MSSDDFLGLGFWHRTNRLHDFLLPHDVMDDLLVSDVANSFRSARVNVLLLTGSTSFLCSSSLP